MSFINQKQQSFLLRSFSFRSMNAQGVYFSAVFVQRQIFTTLRNVRILGLATYESSKIKVTFDTVKTKEIYTILVSRHKAGFSYRQANLHRHVFPFYLLDRIQTHRSVRNKTCLYHWDKSPGPGPGGILKVVLSLDGTEAAGSVTPPGMHLLRPQNVSWTPF